MTNLCHKEQATPRNVHGEWCSMKRTQMTVAIKGGYGCSNFGDDALMIAAFEITKRVFDSASIVFHCKYSDYIQRILPGAKVAPPNKINGKDADIVVYGGGTQFYSFPLTTQKGIRSLFKRVARNARSPVRLGQKLFQKMVTLSFPPLNARIIAIGIGLGPFVENSSCERWTKNLFAQMGYIAVRDVYSYDVCKNWGCSNVVLRSDLCYLPGLWKACVPVSRTDNKPGEIRKVGIIVRDWPHSYEGNSYAVPLFEVVDELRSSGKEVEFISFSERSDWQWARHLKEKNEQLYTWSPEKCTIPEFMELLSSYDAFITARYHGAVFASILGKPVVCVEVEQKLRLVSELFAGGARLWTHPFNATDCIKHVEELERKYSMAVRCLDAVLETQSTLANKMVNDIELFMRGKHTELNYVCPYQ